MSSKFFTNDCDKTLFNKFVAVFEHNPQISEFDALVGYFRASGYLQLSKHLTQINQIRVLVGIDVDRISSDVQRALYFQLRPDDREVQDDHERQFQTEIENSNYDAKTERSIQLFVEDIVNKKIVMKAHPTRRLHAKIYIFRPHDFNEHSSGEVITGSSNLTAAGLGLKENESNYEFNISLRDYDDIKFATDEFEKLWSESVEILPTRLDQALQRSYLNINCTPHEIYIKFLIEYFGQEIEFDPNSVFDLPTGWKRLHYQIDAVEQGLALLHRHNGFFLSDVVGLGKTVVCIMIAKRFFYSNHYPEFRSHTLVVCPPAVKSNWIEIIDQFQVDNVQVITNGSLHKINNYTKYDLVIVDEAHKFRNHTTEGYSQLEAICKSGCRNGKSKRVIVVSATPLNNRPNDIKNQLLLFQNANESTLGININRFFYEATKDYEALNARQHERHFQVRIEEIYDRIRLKVIEPLTVRRTRSDLITHHLYAEDLRRQNIRFPVVSSPQNLLYKLDSKINQLYEESVRLIQNSDSQGLYYARYRLVEYLKPEHKTQYQQPEQFTKQLSAIVKTLLIKRLDSSFYAFHRSLVRLVSYSKWVLNGFDEDRVVIAGSFDLIDYIEQDREDELFKKLEIAQQSDSSIKILTRADFDPEIEKMLESDHEILRQMENQWREVVEKHSDPKLDLLIEQLSETLLNEKFNPSKKLVIFSESTDTTSHISNKLEKLGYRVLSISSKNRLARQNAIKLNFDASVPVEEQKDDIDILITTDALAEGINLHRSNTIVNYDTPWNSTRLMQRIGRINRIGSKQSKLYIYNFFPTEEVEDEIRLQQRAQRKLQAFHNALGEDSQIYSETEVVQSFGLFDQNMSEDDEISDRLACLMEIRKFREEFPDEFDRIKNLPLKSRNAVKDKKLFGGTLCFLRNTSRQDVFVLIKANNQPEELGFLEARKILKMNCESKQMPLPTTHHKQVRQAYKFFEEQIQQQMFERQSPQLSPQQRKAIHYLEVFRDSEITDRAARNKISQAIEWITAARSQNLPRNIVRLSRSHQKIELSPMKKLGELIEIINNHIVAPPTEMAKNTMIDPPNIVISQSYVSKKPT